MPLSPLLAPRYWGFHILALLLVSVAGGLGVWQLNAWSAHRAAEARDLTQLNPRPLDDVIGPDDPFPGGDVGQPVIVEGTWVPESTLYISGRAHDGVSGYWVVTPVAVGSPDGSAVLVVRGWSETVDQAPAPPSGSTGFVAWLQPPEGTGAVDDDPSDDILPQVRLADALQHIDQDLYGAYAVVADKVADGDWPHGETAVNDGSDGLITASLDQLPQVGRTTALRNLLYAIEWWIFGAFAGFIWWRWTRDEVERVASAT